MGIKSRHLYDRLTKIVIDKDLSAFNEISPSQLIPQLSEHFSITIPKEIFNYNEDQEEDLLHRLKELSRYLVVKFAKRDKYPFTIQRICELSYHPLQYFPVHSLQKFVSAMEKCCLVNTDWTPRLGKECPNTNPMEDVSLIPIEWIRTNKEDEKSLQAFISKIETIVAVNFGYDDFDDDNEDGTDHDIGRGYDNHGDVLIEEYEEMDEEFEDEDYEDHEDEEEDEEDEDNDSDVDEMEAEEVEEDASDDISIGEIAENDDQDNAHTDVTDTQLKHNGVPIEEELRLSSTSSVLSVSSHAANEDENESILSRKRNVTELDDYQYKETKENDGFITTPKKSKMPLNEFGSSSSMVSPVVSNQEDPSRNDDSRINTFISPDTTNSVTQAEKNELSTSPLQDKKRMSSCSA